MTSFLKRVLFYSLEIATMSTGSVLLFLSILVGCGASTISMLNDPERKLIQDLFQNYSKEVRPALNKTGEAVMVEFDLAYSQLVSLDSRNQILQSKIWIRQFWVNPFLTWKPDDYGGITNIKVSPKLIWKPDIVLYNSLESDSGQMDKFGTRVQIYHDGTTNWFAPTEVNTICKIDITFFPFDEQQCKLKFGSWTFSGSYLDLNLTRKTADLSRYTLNGEWDLISTRAERNVVKYSCCADPYIDVTYTIHTRRRVLFYINNLILPCIALGVLVVFAFFLPPESGERVSLVITILLGFTVYTLIFTENIPPTSEVTPLLTKYSSVLMVELGFSLVASCLMLYVFHRDPHKDVPAWLDYVVFRVLAKLLRVKVAKDRKPRTSRRHSYGNLLNTTYYDKRRESPILLFRRNSPNNNECTCVVSSNQNGAICKGCVEKKLQVISGKLDDINDKLAPDVALQKRKMKWCQLAHVLDSLFFWIFVFSMLVSTVAFYLLIPSQIN